MTARYVADEDRPAVSYGPAGPDADGEWLLAVTCESDRVDIELGERAMYHLWTEVRGVPWPNPTLPGEGSRRRQDRLVRQLVHAATGADEEMLRDALEALGIRRSEQVSEA